MREKIQKIALGGPMGIMILEIVYVFIYLIFGESVYVSEKSVLLNPELFIKQFAFSGLAGMFAIWFCEMFSDFLDGAYETIIESDDKKHKKIVIKTITKLLVSIIILSAIFIYFSFKVNLFIYSELIAVLFSVMLIMKIIISIIIKTIIHTTDVRDINKILKNRK